LRQILVKLEWENPTGSMKDRMALTVISRPEADGRLKPGDTGRHQMAVLGADLILVAREGGRTTKKLIASRIRQVGIDRVLFGSDAAAGGNLAPREAWAEFYKVPLTEAEFRTITNNVAPYMR